MEFVRDGLLALLEILVNLSLQGSFCILLVLLARFLLRKAPRWCSYVLWSVVFLRLICPVFPEGNFSLMPSQLQIDGSVVLEQVQEEAEEYTATGSIIASEDVVVSNAVIEGALSEQGDAQMVILGSGSYQSGVLQESKQSYVNDELKNSVDAMMNAGEDFNKDVQGQEQTKVLFERNTMEKVLSGIALVWLLGAIVFGAYHMISYQLLKHRMQTEVETQDGVYEVQGEHLSFVMGIVKPKIYLSSGLDAETRKVILCHERVHMQRRDYIFKPLALGISCLHWWNPLVWLAFYLMNKDCEMSCDEKVVALLGEESKTVYSYALLSEATRGAYQPTRRGSVCALLSFGEDHVKNRIRHVLKYKKASIGVICLAVLVLVVLGVGLCSNPKGEEVSEDVADTVSKEQAEALRAESEELQELEKELETAKKQAASKAEQEALQEVLEQTQKEQQEFCETEEYGKIALALEKYALAFSERDGNALFELAGDKVAFGMWDMVYPQEDGTFAFGESSPWVRDWTTLIRTEDTGTATIRFIMENSVPEYYIAEETVKLTPAEEGYYVDHIEYQLYSEINSVAEMEAAYDWTNGDAMKSIYYPAEYVSAILNHLSEGTNPEYYSAYQDPYTAAKTIFHLGADKPEFGMNQYVKHISPQDASVNKHGEGTVCYVTYYFEDGSKAVIPMVLVEESMGIWMPAEDDWVIEAIEEDSSQKQYNAREIYDSCKVGDVTYQLTNMGIYRQDSEGYTFLCPAYAADTAKLAYDDGKLYFPTDSSYSAESLDWWDDSIAVFDIESMIMNSIKLPQAAWDMFPLGALYVGDGYITLWKNDGFGRYCMLLEDVHPVYNGKNATQLDEEEKSEYGKMISQRILENPNQIHCLGHHTKNSTFAFLDLNHDGEIEEVSMTKSGIGYEAPMDSFILSVGEWSQECTGYNQVNEIYAWSPDGEQILILLYEDGPSHDQMTTFYRYENNKLCKMGTIASDVRNAVIENGVISTVIRQDVIQTDSIRVQYRINEDGDVALIEQETYDFTNLNDVELKEVLQLYAEPDGSLDMKVEMKSQTVHITKTDKNFEWVLVEGIDGTKGWLRVKDVIYVGDDAVVSGVIFDGLFFAG
ncbi:MAG: M56 family metallopeptidase [Lachnospiraceae bacterium]|nr:M56 family metallopeptidase [Lachnospiraceae bacterium]